MQKSVAGLKNLVSVSDSELGEIYETSIKMADDIKKEMDS